MAILSDKAILSGNPFPYCTCNSGRKSEIFICNVCKEARPVMDVMVSIIAQTADESKTCIVLVSTELGSPRGGPLVFGELPSRYPKPTVIEQACLISPQADERSVSGASYFVAHRN